MQMTVTCMVALMIAAAHGGDAGAAQTVKYSARLSRAAIDAAALSKVAGIGSIEAELRGTTLTLQGTYSGLLSRATRAHVARGAMKGLRGREIFELTLTPGTAGTIAGTVTLTAAQVEDLHAGRLYVQIDSDSAPDGNLWGWLLPQETRR